MLQRILALFLLLNACLVTGYGQKSKDQFFTNPELFPQQVKDIVGAGASADEATALTNFVVYWRDNVIDSLEKIKLMDLSNLMYDRKSRGAQFRNLAYVVALYHESEDPVDKQNYQVLLDYLPTYVTNRKTSTVHITSFLENIINLLQGNYIFYTTAHQWQFVGGVGKFIVDDKPFRVEFPQGILRCFAMYDSIQIQETSGVLYPFERKWVGNKGLITWERSNYPVDEVNARINQYTVNLTKYEYTADSALFTYKKYFKTSVLGKLNDKVMQVPNPDATQYPRFDTYSVRFLFENLYENVDYDGGFSLRGARIIGSGNETESAKITIRDEKKELMVVRSKYFILLPNRITGLGTAVRINLLTDSIYHPNLTFMYDVGPKEVSMLRTEDYSSQTPFFDSYHKISIDCERIIWRISQPKISFTMPRAATMGRAVFQSENYFNLVQFESLQGMDDTHPLVELGKLHRLLHSDVFPATSFADQLGRNLSAVRQILMYLTVKGFIYYDAETDMITIKDRMREYLRAYAGKVDYDVINFKSETEAPLENALLDMESMDLAIHGIPNVSISDSQSVVITPAKSEIIMKKNRSFQFNGVVDAGLLRFYGSNFFFDYDNFKVNLQNVDSVSMVVYSGEHDEIGRPVKRRVRSVVEHLTGDVYVDYPQNKSGLKPYSEYPKFSSRENSFVFYSRKDIEGGVYGEEDFNFEVYPFDIDSLDNFNKESLSLRGKFHSAGILPEMEQNLVLQPDYSLGFRYNSTLDGVPVYGGKGTLYANIALSNKGLRGKGKLQYVTSTTESKDFKFYPDSMNTQSDKFDIAERTSDVQFPQSASAENYIHWDTKFNEMLINQGNAPFKMMNPQTTLAGKLTLRPGGLEGSGNMNLTTADLQSRHFRYKAQIIDADTSKFLLKSLRKEGYTVLTEENVNSHIDFSIQKGEFVANEDYTKVEFPKNQYISYLDYFKWNMDQKNLEMGARKTAQELKKSSRSIAEDKLRYEEEEPGPRYISVNTKQDSLNFVSNQATYDYQNNLINASNVKLIRSADAIIYTSDGKVTVAEGARMQTLHNTKIVASYLNKTHTLHSASIDITGRKNFFGHGKYDYVDENEHVRTLDMQEIFVDSLQHTIAKAQLIEPDTFKLSPYFAYQGKITLNSSKTLLNYDGAVHITGQCEGLFSDWLRFESDLDPKDLYFPVSESPVSINGKKLFAGVLISSDSISVYPTFFTTRRNYADQYVSTASGFMRYNKDSMVYEIGSKDKLNNRSLNGNYYSLNTSKCRAYGEGSVNLGVDLGQVQLPGYGKVSSSFIDHDTHLDLVQGFQFMFDPVSLNIMSHILDSVPNLEKFDIKSPLFVEALNRYLGNSKAAEYLNFVAADSIMKEFPDTINHTLFAGALHLHWNQARTAYQSEGKIAIANASTNQVNRYVEGFIEIQKRRSANFMDIYLKADETNYFYFGYTPGVMQVYSNYLPFIQQMRLLKDDAMRMKVKRNQPKYAYMISSDVKYASFMRDYKRTLKQRQAQAQVVPTEPEQAPAPAPEQAAPEQATPEQVAPAQPAQENQEVQPEEKKETPTEKKEEKKASEN
jgi:hypothetical protein